MTAPRVVRGAYAFVSRMGVVRESGVEQDAGKGPGVQEYEELLVGYYGRLLDT